MNTTSVCQTGAAAPVAGNSAAPTPALGGSPEFRRLLESLERLTRPNGSGHAPRAADGATDTAPDAGTTTGATGIAADATKLRSALQKADDDFTTAMDLRRRLEEAFQARVR